MKIEDIDSLFENEKFDIYEPKSGHEERFLSKLNKAKRTNFKPNNVRNIWGPIMAIAASFIFIALIFTGLNRNNLMAQNADLASVSPEMKETQDFYSGLIRTELAQLESEKNSQNEILINDALAQMEKLELEYESLKKDLVKSGQDKRVIYAMISNFQQRIDILTHVLQQIETIKELKNKENENNII